MNSRTGVGALAEEELSREEALRPMRRQFADMGDVPLAYGAKLRGYHRRYGDGVTGERHELDFIGRPVTMGVNGGTDVS